ncbi:hypothetical protein [Niveibacterium sp. SC-1]
MGREGLKDPVWWLFAAWVGASLAGLAWFEWKGLAEGVLCFGGGAA